VELCAQIGRTEEIFPALYGRYLYHFARGELFLAHQLANQFFDVAQDRGDPIARATGTRIVGVTSLHLGRPSAAGIYLRQALEQTTQERSQAAVIYPYNPRILCLSYLSATFLTLGCPDQAHSFIRQALADAEALGHPESMAFAMAEAVGFCQDVGDVQAVQERAQALIALATEQGFSHFLAEGRLYQAWARGQHGGIDEAVGQIRQVLSGIRATCKGIGMPYRLLLLAGTHLRARQVSDGLEVSTEALNCVDSTGERWFEAELHRIRAELLLALPVPAQSDAEACFRQAIAVAREQNARMWELRAAASLARLWRDKGRRAEAYHLLAPVYGWFSEGFDTADLKDAKALLDELA